MRLRVIHIPRRGEVAVPVTGNLHSEIDQVLMRSPRVFSHNGLDVFRHPATSPHIPEGQHDVYWLNESKAVAPIAWDDDSVTRVFENTEFWEAYEPYLREQQTQLGESARAYMYWGFHLPTEAQPEFSVVWRGLQSQPRLHFHIAESVENDTADDWLDSARTEHIGHVARFLNLAGERAQAEVLADRPFGEKFIYEQKVYGNDPEETIARTLFAFSSLQEAVKASMELKQQIMHEWLILSTALSHAGPAIFSGQAFTILQSAVPNFVFVIPSAKDSERAGRTQNEVWVTPFSVVGAPDMLTQGGIHLERR